MRLLSVPAQLDTGSNDLRRDTDFEDRELSRSSARSLVGSDTFSVLAALQRRLHSASLATTASQRRLHPASLAMAIINEYVDVSWPGSDLKWTFKSKNVHIIEYEKFVKLREWDHGLVKLVAQVNGRRAPDNPSLMAFPGFQDLLKKRNEAQAEHFKPAVSAAVTPWEAKRPRVEMRSDLKVLKVQLPKVGDLEAKTVDIVRPLHNADVLLVEDGPADHRAHLQVYRSRGAWRNGITTRVSVLVDRSHPRV